MNKRREMNKKARRILARNLRARREGWFRMAQADAGGTEPMNKKEARKYWAAHRQALVDGRAVRLTDDDGNRSIRTFPTWEATEEFLARAEAADVVVEQLMVSLEEQAESLGLPGVPEHWRNP